jgi:hypothetical protein
MGLAAFRDLDINAQPPARVDRRRRPIDRPSARFPRAITRSSARRLRYKQHMTKAGQQVLQDILVNH